MTILNRSIGTWTEYERGADEAQCPASLKAPAGSPDKMLFGNGLHLLTRRSRNRRQSRITPCEFHK